MPRKLLCLLACSTSSALVAGCLLPELEWSVSSNSDAGLDGGAAVVPLRPRPEPPASSNHTTSTNGTASTNDTAATGGTSVSESGPEQPIPLDETAEDTDGGMDSERPPRENGPATPGSDGEGRGGSDSSDNSGSGSDNSGSGSDNSGSGSDNGGSVATCLDGIKNGSETGVDCGGECGLCELGKECTRAEDCASNVCNASNCDPALERCCGEPRCRGEIVCVPGARQCERSDVVICNECGTGFRREQRCRLGCVAAADGASCVLL